MKLLEYYKWRITLDDGSIVEQSKDGDKEPFKFNNKNSKFDKIRTFALIPKDGERDLREIRMTIPEGGRLIYFRRTMANTGNIFPKFHINLLGWQMTVGNKNVKYIMYIYPDGKIETINDDKLTMCEDFIASLPQKDASEVKGCTGCQPKLVKEKK